jgi:hypothetical protein
MTQTRVLDWVGAGAVIGAWLWLGWGGGVVAAAGFALGAWRQASAEMGL